MEKKKSTRKVNHIRKGHNTVTPFLLVNDAKGLIKFLKKAFDGELTYSFEAEGMVMHATVKIGNSIIMLADAPDAFDAATCQLYLYVEDVDSVYKKAVKAGAVSVREPVTEFYGDRAAAVKDQWGNSWWIATQVEVVGDAEMKKREKEFRKQQGGKAAASNGQKQASQR